MKIEKEFVDKSIEKFGEIYIAGNSYADKIAKASRSIAIRNRREEEIFVELQDIASDIQRVPKVANWIAKFDKKLQYAAATNRVNLFPFEKIDGEEYSITLRNVRDEININVKKSGENYKGKFGVLIEKGGVEEKFYFESIDGIYKEKLTSKSESIYNENVNVYFFVDGEE